MKCGLRVAMLVISAMVTTPKKAASPSSASLSPQTTHETLDILVGSYAGKITRLRFQPDTKTFSEVFQATSPDAGWSPSFLVLSPNNPCYLYATNEVSSFDGKKSTGSISSYELQPDMTFRKTSTALTGAEPVSADVSEDGRNVIVAAYTGASASRFRVDEKGAFTSKEPLQTFHYNYSGPNPERQKHSFIHQAKYGPRDRLVFFTDLGGDKLHIHRVLDPATGSLGPIAHQVSLKPGSGPRHVTITEGSGDNYDVYLICELSNQIIYIKVQDTGYLLTSHVAQVISTLPRHFANHKKFAAAEITLTADGKFIYATNRRTDANRPVAENSILSLPRDPHTGLLESSKIHFTPLHIGGRTPRHFSLSKDPHQSYLIIGGQGADTILIYHRDCFSGGLSLLSSTTTPKPAVQIFL